jgi:hypothetical protein
MPCKSSFSTNTSIDIHEDETGETPNLDAKSGCGHAMAQNSQTVLAQESSWLLCGNFTLQGTYGSVLLVGDGRYVVAREHVVAYIQDHFPLQHQKSANPELEWLHRLLGRQNENEITKLSCKMMFAVGLQSTVVSFGFIARPCCGWS